MTNTKVSILEIEASEADSAWGEVSVVEKVVGYKKIKFQTHENTGYGEVLLPEMQMHTTSFWLSMKGGAAVIDGLRGVGVALETVATLALMCETCDLGVALDNPVKMGGPVLFVNEHVPGGTGLAERIFELRETLFDRARRAIASCPCVNGCPACVGPANQARKRAAIEILDTLLG
jgi:DEAD/DEAH box helicase domain-containing protein